MPTHYAIDRFEENGWAVLERPDGQTFNVPREWLPEDTSEGDVLRLELATQSDASRLLLVVDRAEERRRRENAEERRARLPKGPEGDLEL